MQKDTVVIRLKRLSQLTIDAAKDWNGKDITNLGDITLAATKKFKTPDFSIKGNGGATAAIRDAADTDYIPLYASKLIASDSFVSGSTGGKLVCKDTDNTRLYLQARINGGALTTVAQLASAAEPYFEIIRSLRFAPQAGAPGTLVEGMLWYLAANDEIQYRTASSTKTLSSAPTGATAGDISLANNLREYTGLTNGAYAKQMSLVCPITGTLRITYSVYGDGANASVTRIYKNGVAVGTEQTQTDAAYVEKSEDLAFSAGDLLQLYGWSNGTYQVKDLEIRTA